MEEGDRVVLKQPTISGVLIDTRYNKTHRQLEHLLQWAQLGSDGVHERWFLESELEVIADE